MIIKDEISFLFEKFKINVSGILHIGAHHCEELPIYLKYTNKILWIEALPEIVEENKKNNKELKIINAVVTDVDGDDIEFNITNNIKCSSIFDLHLHKDVHPEVIVEKKIHLKTKTIKTIFKENNILDNDFNVLVMDIQGAELLALKGMGDIIKNIEYIYIEVSEKPMYKGSCLIDDVHNFLYDFGFERKYLMLLNNYGNAFYIKNNY